MWHGITTKQNGKVILRACRSLYNLRHAHPDLILYIDIYGPARVSRVPGGYPVSRIPNCTYTRCAHNKPEATKPERQIVMTCRAARVYLVCLQVRDSAYPERGGVRYVHVRAIADYGYARVCKGCRRIRARAASVARANSSRSVALATDIRIDRHRTRG